MNIIIKQKFIWKIQFNLDCLGNSFVKPCKINKFRNSSYNPGKSKKKVQRMDGSKISKNRINPDNSENAGACNNNDCGNHRFPQPPWSSQSWIHESRKTVGKCHYLKSLHPQINNFRLKSKNRKEFSSENQQKNPQNKPAGKSISTGNKATFQYSFFVSLRNFVSIFFFCCAVLILV